MIRKMVILVGDGMGDYPVAALGNRTVLQAASIPAMRRIAAAGRVHSVVTFAPGLPAGSDVGNLGLLGYDASRNYTGRAAIEAAGAGIVLAPDEVAFRCNLVTVRDGRMLDYSAGHITTGEARELIKALDGALGDPGIRFHPGISYRHLLVWRDGPEAATTVPPHDITGQAAKPNLPSGPGGGELRRMIDMSAAVLDGHPVNQARVAAGRSPATHIWLWGQGRAMALEPFATRYGRRGTIISAVDLVRGIGLLAGLQAPVIPGATGFLDTNYEGKVAAALDALADEDFAYVHVEAPDECGHIGDPVKKREAVEAFDARVVAPVWAELERRGQPYRLVVAMDHRTPVSTRVHTRDPVPLAVVDGPVGAAVAEAPFDESVCGAPESAVPSWDLLSGLLRAFPSS